MSSIVKSGPYQLRLFCEVFVRLSDGLKRVGCEATAAASRVVAVKTVLLEYPSVVVEHSLRFVINLVNLSPRGRVDEVIAVFLVLAPMTTTWLYFGVQLFIFFVFASGDILEVLFYMPQQIPQKTIKNVLSSLSVDCQSF